jgi:hypothetical protein
MVITEKIIEGSFHYARTRLFERGLLADGRGLDIVEIAEAYLPSLFGEVGYFFSRDTEGLVQFLGFEAGTIYLPSTYGEDVHMTKKQLNRIILHEFGHAWEWYDRSYFSQKWFKEAFGKSYWYESKEGPELFKIFGDNLKAFKSSPYYDLYITPYAICSPAEDFAETFAFLIENWSDLDQIKSRKGVFRKMTTVKKAIKQWKLR